MADDQEVPQDTAAEDDKLDDFTRDQTLQYYVSSLCDKVQELEKLRHTHAELKERLQPLMEKHQQLASKRMEDLMMRSRVSMLNELYQQQKTCHQKELHQLIDLRRSNEKWSSRLARVKAKDFTLKQEQVEDRLSGHTAKARELVEELVEARKQSIEELAYYVFPIEVQELDEQDVENSRSGSSMHFSTELLVEDDWVLSCQKLSVQPKITIVYSALPADGDYSDYIVAAKKWRKMASVLESKEHLLHHDPAYTISAGLSHIAQYTWLLADLLDVHLVYPYSLVSAISDYGQCDLRPPQEFVTNVARLNNNIVHLCFIQNVPASAITPGHTLKNLHALVTHTQLGRLDPYVCDPELMITDPSGIPYMESDTQPPMTVNASEDDVYSSLEENYSVTMATKDVVHQLENIPTPKRLVVDTTDGLPELVNEGDDLVEEPSINDSSVQALPTSQEGMASSSSSNVVLNTLSSLWTSAWGSWQK